MSLTYENHGSWSQTWRVTSRTMHLVDSVDGLLFACALLVPAMFDRWKNYCSKMYCTLGIQYHVKSLKPDPIYFWWGWVSNFWPSTVTVAFGTNRSTYSLLGCLSRRDRPLPMEATFGLTWDAPSPLQRTVFIKPVNVALAYWYFLTWILTDIVCGGCA